MKRLLCSLLACCAGIGLSAAQHVIRVAPEAGDMTRKLQAAIEQARDYRGQEVVIELQNADYHLYRQSATARTYYCSNTTSETENPDPTKHIGLWFNEQKNITVEGNGARLVTHGELTSFVIDPNKCVGCGACTRACPAGVISGGLKEPHSIDNSRCIVCGSCREACRFDAVEAKGRAGL